MKELSTDINLDEEVAHMAEFIRQKWTPIENIEALFTEIRDAALHAGRAWFDDFEVWELANDLQDERKALLEASLADKPLAIELGVEYYDALCTLLNGLSYDVKNLKEAGRNIDGSWDYTRRVNALSSRLVDKYSGLASARPNGWAELEKGYIDFAGQEEYDPNPDRNLFKGSKVESVCAGPFPSRVALPYVIYEEKCQGFKAYRVLVGAVFAHFLGIIETLNTEKLKQAVRAIQGLKKPVMVFEYNVLTENPLLSVLLKVAEVSPTEERFQQSLAKRGKFLALPSETKEALEKKREIMLDKLIASPNSKEADAARLAKMQNLVRLLNEALG